MKTTLFPRSRNFCRSLIKLPDVAVIFSRGLRGEINRRGFRICDADLFDLQAWESFEQSAKLIRCNIDLFRRKNRLVRFHAVHKPLVKLRVMLGQGVLQDFALQDYDPVSSNVIEKRLIQRIDCRQQEFEGGKHLRRAAQGRALPRGAAGRARSIERGPFPPIPEANRA